MRAYRRLKIEGASYFFTVVTHDRRKLFLDADAVALLNTSIARVRECHPFEVEALVVLPDHLHTLWQLPPNDLNFSTRWRLIKETFTKQWVKCHGSTDASASRRAKGEQAIWQRHFWEHLIRDERDFPAHLDYIHLNPVHHRLVSAPRDWPYSTFEQWV